VSEENIIMKTRSAVMKTTNPNTMAGRFRTVCASMLLPLLLLLLTLPAAVQAQFPLTITFPPVATNVLGTVGDTAIVNLGQVIGFSVGYTNANGGPVSCLWDFGDRGTSSDCEPTHVYTNCGPKVVNVTISDGIASTNASFDVAVPCKLYITKLQGKLNFAKANADSCTVKGTFKPLDTFKFADKLVTLDIGDAQVSFTPNSKGIGHDGLSTLKMTSTTYWEDKNGHWTVVNGLWTFNATLKKGSWQTAWAEYGMISSNIPKPGVLVTNFPVILVVDTEAFMGTADLHYTAKHGKSGTAK
jgi:hypothetical protein